MLVAVAIVAVIVTVGVVLVLGLISLGCGDMGGREGKKIGVGTKEGKIGDGAEGGREAWRERGRGVEREVENFDKIN